MLGLYPKGTGTRGRSTRYTERGLGLQVTSNWGFLGVHSWEGCGHPKPRSSPPSCHPLSPAPTGLMEETESLAPALPSPLPFSYPGKKIGN